MKSRRPVWCDWFGDLQSSAAAEQVRAWSGLSGIVGEAVCASTKAVLRTQAAVARDCAESIATDPRSSKLVVEGAHQAYDLVVAFTEANAQFCDAWLAALRSVEPDALTWLGRTAATASGRPDEH